MRLRKNTVKVTKNEEEAIKPMNMKLKNKNMEETEINI